jgi:hypothetical protein
VVFLVLAVIAGGLAAIVAVLALAFNLAWESRLPDPPAQKPADGTIPGTGQGYRQVARHAGQDSERR